MRGVLWRSCILAAVAMAPSTAWAAWTSYGAHVISETGDQSGVRAVADGSGGFFVFFTDFDAVSGDQRARLLRVKGTGDPAPGWPTNGLAVGAVSLENASDVLSDGHGGAYVCWSDVSAVVPDEVRIMMNHLDGSGALAPGWPVGGKVFPTHGVQGSVARLARAGDGGILALWKYALPQGTSFTHGLFLSEVDSLGAASASFPDTGARVVASDYVRGRPAMMKTSDGASLVGWADARDDAAHATTTLYLQRMLANGARSPGWPANGLARTVTSFGLITLEPDLSGGSFALVPGSLFEHTDSTGSLVPGWDHYQLHPLLGIPGLIASDDHGGLYAMGGYLVLVTSVPEAHFRYGVTLEHFDSTGGPAPSWPDTFRVLDLGSEDDARTQGVAIVRDGAAGIYAFWNHAPTAGSPTVLYANHFAASGAVASGWPSAGALVDSGGVTLADGVAFSDLVGGGYLVYSGGTLTNGVYNLDIWAERVVTDGPVPALASLVSASATDGVAHLEWWSSSYASTNYRIERRGASSDWVSVAIASPDGTGLVQYTDVTVHAGERVGYRLTAIPGGQAFGEVWLQIASAARFALHGVQAIDGGRAVRVAFDLPQAGEPRVRLFDLAGRLREQRSLGTMDAGGHEVQLALPPLEAGLYFVRLEYGHQARSAKLVVAR